MFEKPMIQIHGKTTLSMEFKSTIKTHGNLFIRKPNSHWQYLKPNFHWQHQSPILIGNISKAESSLAISKAQVPIGGIQSPFFHWHYFIKRAQDY